MKITVTLDDRDWGKVARAVDSSLNIARNRGGWSLKDAMNYARIKTLIWQQRRDAKDQPACECCERRPAPHRDVEGVPLCDGCWKQLLMDSADESFTPAGGAK